MNIYDTPIQFIEYSIDQAVMAHENRIEHYEGDLKRVYFAGATLCLDTKDDFGQLDLFTICHSDETFGLFSGGQRRLLSIKALKSLEKLMKMCNVNHKSKWIKN